MPDHVRLEHRKDQRLTTADETLLKLLRRSARKVTLSSAPRVRDLGAAAECRGTCERLLGLSVVQRARKRRRDNEWTPRAGSVAVEGGMECSKEGFAFEF